LLNRITWLANHQNFCARSATLFVPLRLIVQVLLSLLVKGLTM